jgi:plastocyanin
MFFAASTALASSDVVANYTVSISTLGSVPSTLSLAATAPPGITVTIDPPQFTAGLSALPDASIRVDPSTSPGMYNVNITATGGGVTYSSIVSLRVVKFLVVTVGTQFLPQNLTVPINSIVYWVRLNGVISQYDNGQHNVVFVNSSLPKSPALQQWDTYSYQFAAAGDYPYYCVYHPLMKAEITVTP